MRVAVLGAGGVGGYLGARLHEAGAEVVVLARGPHLDAIRSNGLTVASPLGDVRFDPFATDDPAALGRCDYAVVAVKARDTAGLAPHLDGLLGPTGTAVTFQNGIDHLEVLLGALGSERVLGGVAYILSTIERPGVVVHTGGPASFVFGPLDGNGDARALPLRDRLRAAGVEATVSGEVLAAMWDKLGFIVAMAGVTAAARVPVGVVRAVPETWDLFVRLSREACAVARAEGVELPDETSARHQALAGRLEPDSRSSLAYDLAHGKPLELDDLHGAILRRARRHGIPVPMHEAVYAVLRPWTDPQQTRLNESPGPKT